MKRLAKRGSASQFPIPSNDGAYLSVIASSQLLIQSSTTGECLQAYVLPQGFAISCKWIRWYREGRTPTAHDKDSSSVSSTSQQLLLADDTRIMVFDITRPQLYAEISGATTLTRLARVEFGRTSDELIVFSDFGFKMQIWSLTTKRAVEIKDPTPCSSNYSYRPKTGHLALLTRPAAHDVLLIMAPNTYDILGTWELGTVDARGIAYSPDGNWIAVWDTASAGCRVLLLTADGHHFKTYSLPEDDLNLGVSNVQWNPNGERLAVGDHDGNITLLRANTVRPYCSHLKSQSLLTLRVVCTSISVFTSSDNRSPWQNNLARGDRTIARSKLHSSAPARRVSLRRIIPCDQGEDVRRNIDEVQCQWELVGFQRRRYPFSTVDPFCTYQTTLHHLDSPFSDQVDQMASQY